MGLVIYNNNTQALLSFQYLKNNKEIRIHKICAGNDDSGFKKITKLGKENSNIEDFLEYVNNLRVYDKYHIIIQGYANFSEYELDGEFIIKYAKGEIDIESKNSDLENKLDTIFLDFSKEKLNGILKD